MSIPGITPENAAKFVFYGVKEVHECAKVLSENDDLRKSIERRAGDLKQVADELNANEVESFPHSCVGRLQDFVDSINACKRICAELKDKPLLGRMAEARENRRRLENLDKQLEKAQQSLQLALTSAIHAQNRELKECVQKGHERAEATTIHPSIGVYRGAGTRGRRPSEIPAPNVAVIDDLLEIKWTDSLNSAKDIDRYEVRYDDEDEKVLNCEPAEHRLKQDTFALSLGHPKVRAGRQYTISVRAVSSQGPGNWSDPTVARFKIGPPNKPRKPMLTVLSPTEVQVQAPRLDESDENGSPVHQCIVEYLDKNDRNATAWNYQMCNAVRPPLTQTSNRDFVKLSIKCLTPNTIYHFRVRMVNKAGKSAPSDSKEVITTQLIPGPPQELRASSKRLSKYIKLRWREPRQNPQAVFKYQVQMQLAKSKKTPWFDVTTVGREKLSAKPTDLSTGTEYRFRVRALNNQEQGEFSKVLEAETRCGVAAKIAASTGAFFGGAIGGPLLGAIGFGGTAGSAAKDRADSKAGKAAAATAAGVGAGVGGALLGTIGAPLIGGVAAHMAYQRLDKGPDQWSPQTSDDEN